MIGLSSDSFAHSSNSESTNSRNSSESLAANRMQKTCQAQLMCNSMSRGTHVNESTRGCCLKRVCSHRPVQLFISKPIRGSSCLEFEYIYWSSVQLLSPSGDSSTELKCDTLQRQKRDVRIRGFPCNSFPSLEIPQSSNS